MMGIPISGRTESSYAGSGRQRRLRQLYRMAAGREEAPALTAGGTDHWTAPKGGFFMWRSCGGYVRADDGAALEQGVLRHGSAFLGGRAEAKIAFGVVSWPSRRHSRRQPPLALAIRKVRGGGFSNGGPALPGPPRPGRVVRAPRRGRSWEIGFLRV